MRRTTSPERRTEQPTRGRKPRASAERDVLELQRLAGNAAVSSLIARAPKLAPRAPDPGWIDEEEALRAVWAFRDLRLDNASVRAIQDALGVPATGSLTTADIRALSRFRVKHGLHRGGGFSREVLDHIVRERVAVGMEQEMIHLVADSFDLDMGSTLSIRFDPTLTARSTVSFDSAGLRRITVGKSALKSAKTIRQAITAQLRTPAPSSFSPTLLPSLLTTDEAEGAAAANESAFGDRRSVRAIQAVVGAPPTGTFDATTSQLIAELQATLPAGRKDGVIDEAFFHFIVERLAADPVDRDALIRVVVDHQSLREEGVADVSFDASLADDFHVVGAGTGSPATLTFGPSALASQDPADIVHAIARGYEDMRLRQTPRSKAAREFLAKKVEVVSDGMAEEPFGTNRSGFVHDAGEALLLYDNLERSERIALWNDFDAIRNTVLRRFSQATADQQLAHDALLRTYLARSAP